MKYPLIVIISLMLSGCMSPSWHKSRIEEKVGTCLVVGDSINNAINCLEKRGIPLKQVELMPHSYYYYSCWPYWGYPLVDSCGSIRVHTNTDNIIESWKVDGTIEKLSG